MAVTEFFTLSVLLAVQLAISTTSADSWLPNDAVSSPESLNSHSLHSAIVSLESSIAEKNCELAEREESVKIQNIIHEKSDIIASLLRELDVLQIERLRNDIEVQNKKKNKLGSRASVVEKQIDSLKSKLEQLYKANAEQENRIRKTENLLQVAEKELIKAEAETGLLSEDLNQEQWSAFIASLKSLVLSLSKSIINLYNASKDFLVPLSSKVLKQMIPFAQEQWTTFVTTVKHYIRLLTPKIVDIYYSAESSIVPCAFKTLKFLGFYAQEQWTTFVTIVKHYIRLLTPKIVDIYYSAKSSIVPCAFKTLKFLGFYAQKSMNFVSRYLIDKGYLAVKSRAEEVFHAYRQRLKDSIAYHFL